MFELEYKGGNTVVVSTKKSTLVIDPKLSVVGLKELKVKDLIEVITEERFRVSDSDARVVVDGPGEYEVGDFTIRGMAAVRHIDTSDQGMLSTIYHVECGDVRLGILGNIQPKLSEDQYESIGVIDILIIPVGGGGYTLDATSAAAIVRNVGPKVVVPVHYAGAGLSYEVPQDSLDVFVGELGAPVETVPKLKIKTASALPQALTVMAIERS